MYELEKGRECTHTWIFFRYGVRTQLKQELESVLRSSNRNETTDLYSCLLYKVIRQAQEHVIKSLSGCSCNF